MDQKYIKGILVLVITTLFWGSTFPVTKSLLDYASIEEVLLIRFFFTSIILLLLRFRFALSILQSLNNLDKRIFLLGIVNFLAIYWQTIGLKTISSANAGFITAFSVLIVPVMNHIFKIHPFQKKMIISILLALTGIYILSYGLSIPETIHSGDLWILMSAFAYAAYIILVEQVNRYMHPLDILFIIFSITSILFIVVSSGSIIEITSVKNEIFMNSNFIGLMSMLVLPGSVMAYGLMVYGQKFVSSNMAAMIYLLEPVFATLLASVFFNEVIYYHTIAGGSIILFALLISVKIQKS